MKKRKNKLYQSGGQFPNAISYNQLGAIPDNRTSYQPSMKNNKVGRPTTRYSNANLFNHGGSIKMSINSIDRNDILHPAESSRLSYREEPIGTAVTIKKSCYKPNLMQLGGSVAHTPEDFREGLNRGKNIFQFNRKGLKKMTMNPESGAIEYPVDYEGFSEGVQTDAGSANPGEDFTVDGDTVVETPNLSVMDFDKAIDYAHINNLPIFNWRGNKYPVKKNIRN